MIDRADAVSYSLEHMQHDYRINTQKAEDSREFKILFFEPVFISFFFSLARVSSYDYLPVRLLYNKLVLVDISNDNETSDLCWVSWWGKIRTEISFGQTSNRRSHTYVPIVENKYLIFRFEQWN